MVNPRQPPAHLPAPCARSHRSAPSGNRFHFGKSSNAFNAFNAGTSGSPHAALDALTLRHHQHTHRYLLRFPGFHLRHIGTPVPHASAASESAYRHQVLRHRRRVLREECPPVRGECRVQAPPEVTGGECAPAREARGFCAWCRCIECIEFWVPGAGSGG